VTRADVTKEEDVHRAASETVRAFGRVDYAANFAGISSSIGTTWDVPLAEWRKAIDVNQIGVWLCNEYQIEKMKKQEPVTMPYARPQQGSIVKCASVNSIQPVAMSSAYTASEHAVAGLSKTAALEARQFNIRVNVVSPGFPRSCWSQRGWRRSGVPVLSKTQLGEWTQSRGGWWIHGQLRVHRPRRTLQLRGSFVDKNFDSLL